MTETQGHDYQIVQGSGEADHAFTISNDASSFHSLVFPCFNDADFMTI
jgi:hypothetical protein